MFNNLYEQLTDPQNIRTFRVLLLGEGGVGKSLFVRRQLTGESMKLYEQNVHAPSHDVIMETTRGAVRFSIWEARHPTLTTGVPGAHTGYAECAILMYDASSRISYRNVPLWCREVTIKYPEILVVVCANKIDLVPNREHLVVPRDRAIEFFAISAKNLMNQEQPLLYFARMLLNDPHLHIALNWADYPAEGRPWTNFAQLVQNGPAEREEELPGDPEEQDEDY